MFTRTSSLSVFLLALPLLAATAAIPRAEEYKPAGQCSAGALQCCNSVQSASDASSILSLVGTVVGDPTSLVGLTCSPISVIGIAGNSCASQPVCCTNNSFNGVVALGCSPININL